MVFKWFQCCFFFFCSSVKALGDDFNPDWQNTKANYNNFNFREYFPYLFKFVLSNNVNNRIYEALFMPVLLYHTWMWRSGYSVVADSFNVSLDSNKICSFWSTTDIFFMTNRLTECVMIHIGKDKATFYYAEKYNLEELAQVVKTPTIKG